MATSLDSLREVLDRAPTTGEPLAPAFESLDDQVIRHPDDARTLAEIAARFPPPPRAGAPNEADWCEALRSLIGLFQAVDALAPFEILRDQGLPHLLRLFDARIAEIPDTEPGPTSSGEELLFLLKVAGMYRDEEAVDRTVIAARRPLAPESFLWSVVFAVHDADHPYRTRLYQALRDPLPTGFAGVSYLDFANTTARETHASSHPFDSPEGVARLRAYLTESPPSSLARSAAGALPLIARPARDELLALAMDHPDPAVQIEAASGAGRLGSEAALSFLARSCLDPRTLKPAYAALIELGQAGRIPSQALDPDFQALAEMSEWLSHPNEFGRPPDELERVDTRTLAWPPTRDTRRLWLVRYRYENPSPHGQAEEGVGLVGSVTFALFGEATCALSVDDLYGLYCAWELEVRGDPRAPEQRSSAAGRALLDRAARDGPDFA